MTSVVNGDAHKKSDIKRGTENEPMEISTELNALTDEIKEANDETNFEKVSKADLSKNSEKQDIPPSVDVAVESVDENGLVVFSKKESTKKLSDEILIENGIHSSDLGDKELCNSPKKDCENSTENNSDDKKVVEQSCTFSMEEDDAVSENKLDEGKENIESKADGSNSIQDEESSKKESLNAADSATVLNTTENLSVNNCIDKKENVNTNIEDLSKTSSDLLNNKDKEHLNSITPLAKTMNSTSNESLDLSAQKDSANGSIVNGDKNGFVEPNSLEKLNEHLNSLECDESGKCIQNVPLKNSAVKLVSQKSDQSSNKENKNIATHAHDRFKDSPDNFVFAELTNEDTGFPEVFAGLVKIGRYISVKGDFTLRSSEALVESPSLVSSYLLKEPDTFPPKEKDSKSESKDFFHSAAGEILIGIGLSRVNEWYHKDMVRIKKRQMKREGKKPHLEEELVNHETIYTEAKKANSVYSCSYKVCKTCGFTTESQVVLEGHLLVPHLTQRREYQCNFCEKVDRDPKLMLEHMANEHRKIGRIQPPVLFFECPYCSFESNSKVKLNHHLIKCQRYFDHGVNQAPPRDFEFPALTPKPITVAVVKAYEKSLGSMHRGRGRPKKHDNTDTLLANQISPIVNHSVTPTNLGNYKSSTNSPLTDSLGIHNQIMSPMQLSNMNLRPAHSNSLSQIRPSLPTMQLQTPNRIYQVVNSAGQVVPFVGNNHIATSPQFPFASNIVNSGKKMHNSGSPFLNSSPFTSGLHKQNLGKNMPDISITALPKLTGPYPAPLVKPANQPGSLNATPNNLVTCEICDGYVKDLDQLRTHMQLIHKVKIHPKMLVSRPPLNCQKCQWRFFTDQGLERHLLGNHGLVTSNMQELANKNKDAGCCTICGRVYASKLVSHMNQIHRVTLKPAHLSYKCTVCSATFNLYRLFENHVYLVHSGAAKRSSESGRSSPSKKLKTHSDLGEVVAEKEPREHREKKQSKDIVEERICVECGDDVYSKDPNCKKCEKCLKSDELVQGTLNSKAVISELKKNKSMHKAAV